MREPSGASTQQRRTGGSTALATMLALVGGGALLAASGLVTADDQLQPPPYAEVDGRWGEASAGRDFGAASAVYPDPDGLGIWVADRCGENLCVDSDLDPVMHFDLNGNLKASFGAGLMAWPHGMFVDDEGNVWVADAVGYAPVPEGWGHVVYKFSPEGEVLMTLGRKGVAGDGPDTFNKPSDVLVAPDGSIFVADGHDAGGNNRVVKLSPEGDFITAWGETGEGEGQFRDVHALAMDSRGRLFVGDRGNSRIQIFDQDGKLLEIWTQFGRPSGIFIDDDDVIYVADSESNTRRNPGFRRGIYIGNALTGEVTDFIPDPEPDPDNSGTSGAEGVAVDALGDLYGAEVGPRTVRKYRRGAGAADPRASFFLTSRGPGNGADLGGLAGADTHCATLAADAGLPGGLWRAYLSTTGPDGVNARDRIGSGPWYNVRGVMVAVNPDHLHGDAANLTKATVLDEMGRVVNGRGDRPNRHDILTGSQLDGTAFPGEEDSTCGNWTSSAEDGSARVGHHDRTGGGQYATSWNSAHGSRGCSQENLRGTGGDGLFYCFLAGR